VTEEEYQTALGQLRQDWGSVSVDPQSPGILRAANDPSTGVLVGLRAPLFVEIINRALATGDQR
jgi:hypothetical protein